MALKNLTIPYSRAKQKNFFSDTKENIKEKEEDFFQINLNLPDYYVAKLSENKLIESDLSNFVLHRAFLTERNNQRQGTVSTKTRSEVRGGGRKPWRQKGSGKARAGSTRSPLWKGGGVSFGPKPKIYFKKINRKEWRLSLRLLLVKKRKNIQVVDNFLLDSSKTKIFLSKLESFGFKTNETCSIILPTIPENIYFSSRNLKNIKILKANNLSINSLLHSKNILITQDSFKIIKEIYNE